MAAATRAAHAAREATARTAATAVKGPVHGERQVGLLQQPQVCFGGLSNTAYFFEIQEGECVDGDTRYIQGARGVGVANAFGGTRNAVDCSSFVHLFLM